MKHPAAPGRAQGCEQRAWSSGCDPENAADTKGLGLRAALSAPSSLKDAFGSITAPEQTQNLLLTERGAGRAESSKCKH